jgi:CHASE3 domain sensor protein
VAEIARTIPTGRGRPMTHEALKDSVLSRTLSDLLADFTDLMQKEIRLARAEISEKVSAKLHALVWMGTAGLLGLVVALLVIEGIVFALMGWGLSPAVSCLLVAAVVALLAVVVFYQARSMLAEEFLPTRTARQINQDIRTAKEQLT